MVWSFIGQDFWASEEIWSFFSQLGSSTTNLNNENYKANNRSLIKIGFI